MSRHVDHDAEPPDQGSVRVSGTTICWTPVFRELMARLCSRYGFSAKVPAYVGTAVLQTCGVLLLWPVAEKGPSVTPVQVSPRARRVAVSLEGDLRSLHVALPPGVTIGVPVTPFQSPRHGRCLALHFRRAEFLYKQSRSTAIGLLP